MRYLVLFVLIFTGCNESKESKDRIWCSKVICQTNKNGIKACGVMCNDEVFSWRTDP